MWDGELKNLKLYIGTLNPEIDCPLSVLLGIVVVQNRSCPRSLFGRYLVFIFGRFCQMHQRYSCFLRYLVFALRWFYERFRDTRSL